MTTKRAPRAENPPSEAGPRRKSYFFWWAFSVTAIGWVSLAAGALFQNKTGNPNLWFAGWVVYVVGMTLAWYGIIAERRRRPVGPVSHDGKGA